MKKKILMTCLCVALAVLTIAGTTLAYLTSTAKVENTFTVGNVKITLDELDITKTDGSRTSANTYHLMPGHVYTKDPTVHVDAVSEDSWIFVKVENGISAFEAATVEGGYTAIADQITTTNGWTALEGVAGVYYKSYSKSADGANLVVFSNFKMSDTANEVAGWGDISAETTKVTVTAYAVQKDGFNTADAAWAATFGQPAGN